MKFAAMTSMNETYYDHVGRAMLRTYKQTWSDQATIHVYNENNFQVKVKTVVPMGWEMPKEFWQFQLRHTNRKIKQFSKKAWSIMKGCKEIACDRLIWIDADTIMKASIPLQLLYLISPNDTLSTHFSVWHDVEGKTYHSCETGFFILNKNHPAFQEFVDTYEDIYINDKHQDLRRFYDGEVYGKTVRILEAKGNKMLDLNLHKINTPIPKSVLAPYINHMKAGAKDTMTNDIIEQKYKVS